MVRPSLSLFSFLLRALAMLICAHVQCQLGSAGPKGGSAYFCSAALQYAPHYTCVFQVEYRLSQGPPLEPSGAFPAALIDAMLSYDYLVTVGFNCTKVESPWFPACVRLLTNVLVMHHDQIGETWCEEARLCESWWSLSTVVPIFICQSGILELRI